MTRPLTASEERVVALVAAGLPNRQIAEQLGIAEDTVKHHVSHAIRACGVSNRVQLALAYLGVLGVPPPPPRGWDVVATIARSGDSHWVGPDGDSTRRLCVHTAAGPLGWDVPHAAVPLMPPMPLSGVDHSGDEETTYRRLAELPVRHAAARREAS